MDACGNTTSVRLLQLEHENTNNKGTGLTQIRIRAASPNAQTHRGYINPAFRMCEVSVYLPRYLIIMLLAT